MDSQDRYEAFLEGEGVAWCEECEGWTNHTTKQHLEAVEDAAQTEA